MNYQKMLVIFIDLLGSQNNQEFDFKYLIHRNFHEELKQNEERQKNLDHVIYNRKIYSFSDCAYIFYYYKEEIEESRKDDNRLIFTALFNTSISILKILQTGNLIRGGIAFGDVFLDEIGFFGPAVDKAYNIESKQAKNPCIMIENSIGKSIFNHQLSSEEEVLYIMAMLEPPRLIFSEDNNYFLNYFYPLKDNQDLYVDHHLINLNKTQEIILKRIENDLDSIEKKIIIDENDKIKNKLIWLKNNLEMINATFQNSVILSNATDIEF